jgi:hypothetical protein
MVHEISAILADVSRWARSRSDVRGLAVVGSYASGKARPDSDVDLVIVTDDPAAYGNAVWMHQAVGRCAVTESRRERFGNVWSTFVTLAQGPEIEFTFAEPSWAKADPPAAEVCDIVRGGIVILHDPHGELRALCSACGAKLRE